MVTARTTRPGPTTTTTRRTKLTVVKAEDDGDKLAKDLERVLKVSEPTPQDGPSGTTIRRKAVATSSKAIPAPVTKKVSVTTGSKAPTTVRTKQPVPLVKSKIDVEPTLPWAKPDLPIAERAKGAMSAINLSIKFISTAIQAGYRSSQTSSSTLAHGQGQEDKGKGKETESEEWTDERVDVLLQTCEIALRILREMDQGQLGAKGIEVEKAGLGVIGKCLAMGMVCQLYNTALYGSN